MPRGEYSPIKPIVKDTPIVNDNPIVNPFEGVIPEEANPVVPPDPVVLPNPPSIQGQADSEGDSSFLGFGWQDQVDPDIMKKLNGLFRQRNQIEQKIVRIQFALRDQKLMSLAQLNVISSKLAAAYTEFSKFHSEIMALIPDAAEDEQEEIYTNFEERYDMVSTVVQDRVLALNRSTSSAAANPQVIIQQQSLKVPIPTFDGNYTNWPKFKAIFQDLMENSADSDAIKIYHLDKTLVGAAAGSLDAKIINEGNYRHAWKVLSDRYENQRVIVETHLRGLLTLKKMSSESFKELRCLLDEASGHVESLRYLKQELTGVSEHLVVYLITAALDKVTRKAWESTLKSGELPKYIPTIEFLKSRCQILENFEMSQISTTPVPKPKFSPSPPKVTPQKSIAATSSSPGDSVCDICSGHHFNYQCSELKQMTPKQRLEKLRSKGLCFNCLRKGHQSNHCPSDRSCRNCNKKHHSLLHEDSKQDNGQHVRANVSVPSKPTDTVLPIPASPPTELNRPVSTTCSCSKVQESKTVLLLTAIVDAFDKYGQPHPCRVLLDCGSQVNFVTEGMANLLGMPKTTANVPITGINALRSLARDKVFVTFRSRYNEYQACLECLVTPKVTQPIPSTKFDVSSWNLPEDILLADPKFHKPDKIDLLIGGELFFNIIKPNYITLGEHLPTLCDTYLGWVVTGAISTSKDSDSSACHSNIATIEDVEEMIHQFWELEEVPTVSNRSTEEQCCEDHFRSTYKRDSTGRFVVRLPFKHDVDQLDDCRALALKRFLMLEKRFKRDPNLRDQYVEFLHEYESLGHCHQIDEANDPPRQSMYYMPHHAVLRPTSSSTKCRVVGPVVQSDLYSIMLRFRIYPYAFSADISKMYRQVLISPEDRQFLRIFWREHPSQPLRVLELDTVTYGTASAPYQATRCLMQLAEDEASDFPTAARILKEDFYVDDTLSGAETLEELIDSQTQLEALLARGGFQLHKWCSNSDEFLQRIPAQEREKQVPFHEYGVNEVIKVLGLYWDPKDDRFLIANTPTQSVQSQSVTKRTIYSEVARLFDPLGLFSPVIIVAKLFIQQLWKIKCDWDEPLDLETQQRWMELRSALPQLNLIQVPRCVTFPTAVFYEVHGFADASNVAYGACLYLRSVFTNGSAKLRLLTSKSKVAPLHELSIPRKELCAALLLTRLLEKAIPALKVPFQRVMLWSDSTIVLAWLRKPPISLQTFVRNRVAEIQANTREYQWNYIRSKVNPADFVSRGQLPQALSQNSLWWDGPSFLTTSEYETETIIEFPEQLPEMKVVVATPVITTEPFLLFSSQSSYRKIQRIIGYVLRFAANCKKSAKKRLLLPYLTVEELRRSNNAIMKVIQRIHLADEIDRVIANQPCKRIANLRPFYEDGLLRVGGRLFRSQLPFVSKHQIILPDKDPVTKKLIQALHVELLHVGQAGLISAIRQRYWLLNARSTVRQVTRQCVQCFRTNPVKTSQLMGNLPETRIVPSPPFATTGVDYAGPIVVKQGKYRLKLVKSYIAVFVCMATKAIHLEAVSDLTTNAFLAALRRFVSRRGMVHQIFSDNATNFKGAKHELHELYCHFQNEHAVKDIQDFCRVREVEWYFIPPDAPEFGGLWEAAVKSTKTHLKRVVGNATLTFEELATVLTEIEAVLNSRPMFAVSNDPADPQVITPAHYLIGRPLTAPAEPSLENVKASRLDRWQHLQLMREHFWRAWSRDYLASLQPRKKNMTTMPNVRPGMIVLIHDKNQPPLNWKYGRIVAVYPGEDTLVRTVDVFTNGVTYRRPITKISILPIEDNSSATTMERFEPRVPQPGGVCSVPDGSLEPSRNCGITTPQEHRSRNDRILKKRPQTTDEPTSSSSFSSTIEKRKQTAAQRCTSAVYSYPMHLKRQHRCDNQVAECSIQS